MYICIYGTPEGFRKLRPAASRCTLGEHKKVYESSGCMGQSSFKVIFQKYVTIEYVNLLI